MKHIVKGLEPQELIDFKASANDNWQPCYDNLSQLAKPAIVNALMKEQGYICCYCEQRLEENDSHIEHFRPQSDSSCDPLDFNNMLRSCQKETPKGNPLHCGKLKDDWFDEESLMSPLDPSCEEHFSFNTDGKITPTIKTDTAAKKTIEKLGLDIPKLNDMRQGALEPFLDSELTDDDLKRFVSGYLQVDDDGKYGEFWSMIKYLFKDYLVA